MPQVRASVSRALLRDIDEAARLSKRARSDVVRCALEAYLSGAEWLAMAATTGTNEDLD